MSKILFVLSLLALVSCGQDQQIGELGPGENRVFQPVTNYEDNERVKTICNAISAKEGQLNVLVNSAKEYTFSYQQKNCDTESMPSAKDVPTRISRNGSSFYFAPKNGENFGFADVETTDDGVMRAICNFGGTLESPIRESNSTAVWWTTFTSTEHCSAGFGNICIELRRGSSKDGSTYKMHTVEWIKFKVLDGNEGFFIQRKLVSNAGCKDGKYLEMRATLK